MFVSKKFKKLTALALAFVFALTTCVFTGELNANAAEGRCESYKGSNAGKHNYGTWAATMKSYLHYENDEIMRFQADATEDKYLIEYYDTSYNFKRSVMLDKELPLFGQFYASKDYYFIISGQTNLSQSAEVEVYRITKYDKNWQRIDSVGLNNCNTTKPFNAGSCRTAEMGKYLIIRTCHEMYKSNDGYNHQANVTIQVDIEKMQITDSFTGVLNIGYGYVSHSFNQFIHVENNKLVAVDHGDAYPRSIALLQYTADASGGQFSGRCNASNVMEISGKTGDNYTGVSVGGFELSDSSYLIAGNSVDQSTEARQNTRNIFVAAVSKADTSKLQYTWLTTAKEGEETSSTPQLVKISDNKFAVLWTKEKKVYYAFVDGQGNQVGETNSFEGNLSDCKPIVAKDKIVWYIWQNEMITFYEIHLTDNSNSKVAIQNGHVYQNKGVSDGYATLYCTRCGLEDKIKVTTNGTFFWSTNGTNYSTAFSKEWKVGETYYFMYRPADKEANSDMLIEVENDSIISVEPKNSDSYTNYILKPLKAGSSKVTIRARYNPEYYREYNITVVNSIKYGDVNGDGEINTTDAVLLKKHLADYSGINIDMKAADMNADGFVNITDAVLLLKYLAGYKITLEG